MSPRKSTGDPVLGGHLRYYRKQDKRTLKEVAGACGISASVLSEYELGKKLPSSRVLNRLARYYRVSVDALTRHWRGDVA
jgi:transcriptional regulator with XRE-family HTH domain